MARGRQSRQLPGGLAEKDENPAAKEHEHLRATDSILF
jgi:hypothetical protein